MQPRTINALLEAYRDLHRIADQLYEESQLAFEQDLENDASLLVSQADKIFELAENLDVVISELED